MIKRLAISAFVLFHLIAITCWAIPLNTRLFSSVNNKIAPYMSFSGLSQDWALFAPDPGHINCRLEAEITYGDGSTLVWKFPLPQDFGYSYFKERDRKWSNDSVRLDQNAVLWPDTARYIARHNNDRTSPPLSVKLVRYWSEIFPPGTRESDPWHQYVFFTYAVVPEDLR